MNKEGITSLQFEWNEFGWWWRPNFGPEFNTMNNCWTAVSEKSIKESNNCEIQSKYYLEGKLSVITDETLLDNLNSVN